MTSPRPSGLFI